MSVGVIGFPPVGGRLSASVSSVPATARQQPGRLLAARRSVKPGAEQAAEGTKQHAQHPGDDDEGDCRLGQIGLRLGTMDLMGDQDEGAEDHPGEQTTLGAGGGSVVVEAGPDPADEGDDRKQK